MLSARISCSVFLLIAAVAACSSSSSSDSSQASSAGSTTACSSIAGVEFQDNSACFVDVTALNGLCRQDPAENRTLGLESVCVADSADNLYVVSVGTDTYLYGDGWTIGSRAAPDAVKASTTPLTSADETRCAHAMSLGDGAPLMSTSTPTCGSDAGTTDQ